MLESISGYNLVVLGFVALGVIFWVLVCGYDFDYGFCIIAGELRLVVGIF